MPGLLTNAARSYPFDVRQFHRMTAAGIFDDQKVELVGGTIYALTDLPTHTFGVGRFHEGLRALLPRDVWTIREEKPILIGRYWAPKPDIAVVFGSDATFAARHPRPRHVALLVEVSDTTYRRDRGQKWRRYASAGIPLYMIIRLKGPDTHVELWTGPTGRGRTARYTDVAKRYHRMAQTEAEMLYNAIADPLLGVMPWIKTHY
jgi:hypothetical protein